MEPILFSAESTTSDRASATPSASTSSRQPMDTNEPSFPEPHSSSREEMLIGNGVLETITVKTVQSDIIRPTRYRYLIIILFALFGFINQVQYVAFATIIREVEEYFNVQSLAVNVLSLLIPIIYVVGVVPGCFLYNRVGLRFGMIIGAAVNAFASALKLIAVWAPKYPLLVVAQVFVAFGQILYLSLPTLVSGIWFPPNERTVATAVASLMGFAGMAVGMFYSPHVVSLPDENTPKEWADLMGSQFGLSMLVLVLMGIFAREKPPYRPSQTSSEDYKLPLARFLKSQLRNWNLMVLGISFGLILGFLTALAGMLAQIVEPYKIKEDVSGILAFAGILGGAVNCGVIGLFVDRTHYYKYTAIALATTTTALLVTSAVVVKTITDFDMLAVAIYILVPLLEFLVLPIIPVVMELAVELAYPCPETVSSTIVLACMCFFSFAGMIVFSVILGDVPTTDTTFYCLLTTLMVSALSVVGLCFVKENLCRHAEDDALEAAITDDDEENDNADDAGGEEEVGNLDSADHMKNRRDVRTGIATITP